MLQLFKEIYLTMFIIYFKVSTWPFRTKSAITSGLIAIIETCLLLAIESWISIFIGMKITLPIAEWTYVVAMTVLFIANLKVARHYVPVFQHEFAHFRKSKKILLLTTSVVIMLAVIVFFACSISTYHNFFHITPKD